MTPETLLQLWGFLPSALWVWDDVRGKPPDPRRPQHQRPARPQPEYPNPYAAMREVSTEAERDMIACAEDEDACHEAMIWEAGRIHGPEGLSAAALVLEVTVNMIEDGCDPPSWWDAGAHSVDLALSALRALHRADDLHNTRLVAYRAESRAIATAPEADPEWAAYDAARAAYPGELREWVAARDARAAEATGHPNREAHARALLGVTLADVDRAVRGAGHCDEVGP